MEDWRERGKEKESENMGIERERERGGKQGEGRNCGLYCRCFWPKKISRSCAIFLRLVILGEEWIRAEK